MTILLPCILVYMCAMALTCTTMTMTYFLDGVEHNLIYLLKNVQAILLMKLSVIILVDVRINSQINGRLTIKHNSSFVTEQLKAIKV